jgi:hypothetical protein
MVIPFMFAREEKTTIMVTKRRREEEEGYQNIEQEDG